MERKRKVYAPFSQTSEAGVTQTPVEGYIDVNQTIYPTVSTGVVNEKGQWSGVKSNDREFIGLTKHVLVANGASVINPDTANFQRINCEGFSALQFAIKCSRSGNIALKTQMGPDTEPFLNLSPIEAGNDVRITDPNGTGFENIVDDGTETIGSADQWKIYTIAQTRVLGQNNFVIKITNNTGADADFEFAFRRLV